MLTANFKGMLLQLETVANRKLVVSSIAGNASVLLFLSLDVGDVA